MKKIFYSTVALILLLNMLNAYAGLINNNDVDCTSGLIEGNRRDHVTISIQNNTNRRLPAAVLADPSFLSTIIGKEKGKPPNRLYGNPSNMTSDGGTYSDSGWTITPQDTDGHAAVSITTTAKGEIIKYETCLLWGDQQVFLAVGPLLFVEEVGNDKAMDIFNKYKLRDLEVTTDAGPASFHWMVFGPTGSNVSITSDPNKTDWCGALGCNKTTTYEINSIPSSAPMAPQGD